MRLWTRFAFALVFLPVVASAQFKDLDSAMSSLAHGFSSGDAKAIVAGIREGHQVMLQFPRLVSQSGFFGHGQAAHLLCGLFNKFPPTAFHPLTRPTNSAP